MEISGMSVLYCVEKQEIRMEIKEKFLIEKRLSP